MSKSPLFGQNRLQKSAWWRPPDSDEKLDIVKKGHQNLYEVQQGNHSGSFINLRPLRGSFWQKIYFLVKIDSRNQPSSVPLFPMKN